MSITDEMRRSYLDYAMSVIVSRALPDVRDGLKPVHRRILFSMYENSFTPDKPHRKSARVVGDVVGKYHPHGEGSIYDALARMAQDFSMRLPLIDGQGNFGSVDGDPPASMRYTEVRLAKPTLLLVDDLGKDTVDFRDNYDGSEREPVVLPARLPNLLINGAGGIAVGMATNIPPHNLGEVIDACCALIDNPHLSFEDLMICIPGPDFPTGALILGSSGTRSAYSTGRGSIIMRATSTVEEMRKERMAIIITAIPYQVNKASLIEKIAELVRDKKIEGISDLRDESNRKGVRVVIELKRDATPEVILNQLYRYTPLQTTFGANMVALNGGRPELITLHDMLVAFIDFRREVVSRRTKFLLRKARDRVHVLIGFAITVANIEEVVRLIRKSTDPAQAREALMSREWPAKTVAALIALVDDRRYQISETGTYRLSDVQAQSILALRLQRLTALGQEELSQEINSLTEEIKGYLATLSSPQRLMTLVKEELLVAKAAFATPRLTQIVTAGHDLDDEDLIQQEDMVVTVSHAGYIKRVPLALYRAQRRGGKGRSGMQTREADFVTRLFVANTHTPVLFFSSHGQVYKEKVWRLPLAAPTARGKALANMLPLDAGETMSTILPLDEYNHESDGDLMFATRTGFVRRNKISDFIQVNRSGKIAMKLEEGDFIVGVSPCTDKDDVLLTTKLGRAIRFPVSDVRIFKGRDSVGVRGIGLDPKDCVISMAILRHTDATAAERLAYARMASAARRAAAQAENEAEIVLESVSDEDYESAEEAAVMTLSEQRQAEMAEAEQFILTISENGFGKRSSAYEFRITRRGGKGISAMAMTPRNGPLISSFPINHDDHIMLVTDNGQLIRCPVNGIRVTGRTTQGVTVFNTAATEKVVCAERITEDEAEESDVDAA
jgi:DNA gyrase subunit A